MYLKDNQTTSNFKTNNGLSIFYRNWKTINNPKAVVLIVHGLNSHSGYYQNFALQLIENSYEVYALDLRGRGHSSGERYYISDYRDIVADINQLVNIVHTHPPLPIFLLGHSAGGVFASVYAVLYQDRLKGLISESFAFQIPAPGFALAAIKLLAHIIPHRRIVRLKNADFSRDKTVVNTMNEDPLIDNEKQPAKTMQQLFLAADYLKEEMAEIKIPLLVLHGTADKATKPDGSKYFIDHVASVDKQLILYDGHFHDLLSDEDNTIVITDIISWLNKRL